MEEEEDRGFGGVGGSPEIRSETVLTSPIHLPSFPFLPPTEEVYIAPDSAVNKKVTTYGGRTKSLFLAVATVCDAYVARLTDSNLLFCTSL